MNPTGFQNPLCYARALGGCSDRITEEHYVTDSVLRLVDKRSGEVSETVDVTNLAFQYPGKKKKLTIGRLTAPILCETHNNRLSHFDQAGLDMFVAMDGLNEYVADPELPFATHRVDGVAFERWMLKTLCGGLYSGMFPLPPGVSCTNICPPNWWLDILYNGAAFPADMGFYHVYKNLEEPVTTDNRILNANVLLANGGGTIRGFQIQCFGFRFILLMDFYTQYDPPDFEDAVYRPEGIKEVTTGAFIQFVWKEGSESPAVEVKSLGVPSTS